MLNNYMYILPECEASKTLSIKLSQSKPGSIVFVNKVEFEIALKMIVVPMGHFDKEKGVEVPESYWTNYGAKE